MDYDNRLKSHCGLFKMAFEEVDVVILLTNIKYWITVENLLRDDMQFIIDDNTEDELYNFLNRFDISEVVNRKCYWRTALTILSILCKDCLIEITLDVWDCWEAINEVAIYTIFRE